MSVIDIKEKVIKFIASQLQISDVTDIPSQNSDK
jgi:hypothetical protein